MKLSPTNIAAIEIAIGMAKEHPVPFEVLEKLGPISDTEKDVIKLSDRRGPGIDREKYRPVSLTFGDYRMAIMFEQQPECGMVRHLSVSSKKGTLPGLEALTTLVNAFGFSGVPLSRPGRVWVEEFEPDWFAVNIIEVEKSNEDSSGSDVTGADGV